jgi:hypothetical protein
VSYDYVTHGGTENIFDRAETDKTVSYQQSTLSGSLCNSVEDDHWKYAQYMQLLIELQKAGHDCHIEINETLKKLHGLMFKKE